MVKDAKSFRKKFFGPNQTRPESVRVVGVYVGEEEQQIPSENDLSSRRQKHSATAVNSPKVADSGKALCFGLDLNTCNRHRQLPARFPETSRPAPAN